MREGRRGGRGRGAVRDVDELGRINVFRIMFISFYVKSVVFSSLKLRYC